MILRSTAVATTVDLSLLESKGHNFPPLYNIVSFGIFWKIPWLTFLESWDELKSGQNKQGVNT